MSNKTLSNINELENIDPKICDEHISKIQERDSGIDKAYFDKLSLMPQKEFDTIFSKEKQVFDIFLSHTAKNKPIIKKLFYYLEVKCGYKVYIDWINDPFLKRNSVTKKSVRLIQIRLKQSQSILLCKSKNFRSSRWIMWEIGYFAGMNHKNMAQINLGQKSIKKLEFLLDCHNAIITNYNLWIQEKKLLKNWREWIQ
jgi:hypothetical protein